MGADNILYETGKYAKAVFVKGGSGDPSTLPGTVDSVAVAPTFTVASLSGYGDDYFDSWYAYVVWDKDGAAAAPQGESKAITAYTSSTGTFAHAAFTVPLVAGDKILISLSDPNAAGDASAAAQAIIIADTEKLYDVAFGTSPQGGSLASYIATGGVALGTSLPNSKSLYDVIALDRLDHATYGLSALDTELGLIPQSGGAVSWNATALAAIQAEAEDAIEGEDLDHLLKLDGAAQKYPENCATDSVVAKLIAKGDPAVPSTYDCTTDSQQALSDKFGGFSGDGGAAQDDSVKASMDLAHTDIDTIIASTSIRRVASGSKTLATGVTKYLSIDSGTNGAEIIGMVIKGVVGADWTLDVYVPTADAVAAPAAGDKRDTNAYIVADAEGGMLSGFAIPYNCFFDFTNDSAGDDNVDDVVILYRSASTLTLAWEA